MRCVGGVAVTTILKGFVIAGQEIHIDPIEMKPGDGVRIEARAGQDSTLTIVYPGQSREEIAAARNPAPVGRCAICLGAAPVDICAKCQADCDQAYGAEPTYEQRREEIARRRNPQAETAAEWRADFDAWQAIARDIKRDRQTSGIARAAARLNERGWRLGYQQEE